MSQALGRPALAGPMEFPVADHSLRNSVGAIGWPISTDRPACKGVGPVSGVETSTDVLLLV